MAAPRSLRYHPWYVWMVFYVINRQESSFFPGKPQGGRPTMSDNPKTVLVAEDKASLTQMLKFLFLSKGLKVEIAYNGSEALEKAVSLLPDLILLDIMMPEMDGFEVLERLRENGATSQIPIIMLTARKSREDMEKAKELGAVEYITKPFKAIEVVDKVLRHLG